MENEAKHISTNTRITAFLVSVIFIFVMTASLLFIVENYEHDCTGEDCYICHEIMACEFTLQTAAAVVAAFAAAKLLAPFVDIFEGSHYHSIYRCITLVSLKVLLII